MKQRHWIVNRKEHVPRGPHDWRDQRLRYRLGKKAILFAHAIGAPAAALELSLLPRPPFFFCGTQTCNRSMRSIRVTTCYRERAKAQAQAQLSLKRNDNVKAVSLFNFN